MRVPLSWIDQFTPLPHLPIAEISRRFTLSSCEVESTLACMDPSKAELWSQVQLVEIVHIAKHPKAEKLWLPTISNGSGSIQLVCGANNLYVGMKTLWAPAGTAMRSVYDGQNFVLQDKEIMGVMSCGMLCSERELGISDNHEGIIDLSELALPKNSQHNSQPYILGMSFAEILCRHLELHEPLQLNGRAIEGIEFIFDIDNKSLTHRPDMWGIYGMAREFGAVFPKTYNNGQQGDKLKPQMAYGPSIFRALYDKAGSAWPAQTVPTASPIVLDIKRESSCLSYCALALEGIAVTHSPPWLQQRLRLAGVSVINSVVDISNYVMLELGIPNHIFDREQLSGSKICVYRLQGPLCFQTLDGQQRKLQAGDTVVADEKKTSGAGRHYGRPK